MIYATANVLIVYFMKSDISPRELWQSVSVPPAGQQKFGKQLTCDKRCMAFPALPVSAVCVFPCRRTVHAAVCGILAGGRGFAGRTPVSTDVCHSRYREIRVWIRFLDPQGAKMFPGHTGER